MERPSEITLLPVPHTSPVLACVGLFAITGRNVGAPPFSLLLARGWDRTPRLDHISLLLGYVGLLRITARLQPCRFVAPYTRALAPEESRTTSHNWVLHPFPFFLAKGGTNTVCSVSGHNCSRPS